LASRLNLLFLAKELPSLDSNDKQDRNDNQHDYLYSLQILIVQLRYVTAGTRQADVSALNLLGLTQFLRKNKSRRARLEVEFIETP
jgi:hypothetical protein